MKKFKYTYMIGISIVTLSIGSAFLLKLGIDYTQNQEDHQVTLIQNTPSRSLATTLSTSQASNNDLTQTSTPLHYQVKISGSDAPHAKLSADAAASIGANTLFRLFGFTFEDTEITMSYISASGILSDSTSWIGEVQVAPSTKYRFIVDAENKTLSSLQQLTPSNDRWHFKQELILSEENKKVLSSLDGQLDELQHKIDVLSETMEQYGNHMGNIGEQMGTVGVQMAGINGCDDSDKVEMDQLDEQMDALGQEMDRFGKIMDDAGKEMDLLTQELTRLCNHREAEKRRLIKQEAEINKASHLYDDFLRLTMDYLQNLEIDHDVTSLSPSPYLPCILNGKSAFITQTDLPNGKTIWITISQDTHELLSYEYYSTASGFRDFNKEVYYGNDLPHGIMTINKN